MEFTVYKKTDDIDEEFAGKGAKKKKQKEKSPKNHLISGIVHSLKKIILLTCSLCLTEINLFLGLKSKGLCQP